MLSKAFEPQLTNRFNAKIAWMYDDCRDVVQMHYFVTSREDTNFWKANRYELKIADSIQNGEPEAASPNFGELIGDGKRRQCHVNKVARISSRRAEV